VKLASLRSGGRDGTLVVVTRDLKRARAVPEIAPTLQAALDRWHELAPRLEQAAAALANGMDRGELFDPRRTAAPLPRAYHWVDGSAYVTHVELVRKARGADMPSSFWTDPLVYQGGSDDFLGATDDVAVPSDEFGIDIEGEVAVITDDVPMATTPHAARGHVKLLLLVNDWTLRNLVPAELAKGFGFYQSKPATAFSPVAVTPDELGAAWDGGRVHLPLVVHVKGELLGRPLAGVDMTFDFPQLIAHATKTRRMGAGSIVGSGTVSNHDRSHGCACIAERRVLEQLEHGAPRTAFLQYGDRVRLEMFDATGDSIFGAIDQCVIRGPSAH
jgi:fumarylacetoacetate (FAA) hydrolase